MAAAASAPEGAPTIRAAMITGLFEGDEYGPQTVPIDLVRDINPDQLSSCRRPPSHIGMPNFIGLLPVPASDPRKSVWFESLNEQHHYIDLMLTGAVAQLETQPFRIEWPFARGVREHTPDAFALTRDGTRVLIDVTRQQRLEDPAALAIFVLTAMTAAALGWDYELRVELPLQRVRTLRFLWAYRLDPLPDEWRAMTEAVQRITHPCSIAQLASSLGNVVAAPVWQLIGHGVAHVDLDRPLTPDSAVYSTPLMRTGTEPWIAAI